MLVQTDTLYLVNDDALGVGVFSQSAEKLRFVKSYVWKDWKQARLNGILRESEAVNPWDESDNNTFVLQEGIPRIVGCRRGDVIFLSLQDSRGEKTMEWRRGQKCPLALSPEEIYRVWYQTRLILRFQTIERIVSEMRVDERAKSLILSLAREGREEEIMQFIQSFPPVDTIDLRLFLF